METLNRRDVASRKVGVFQAAAKKLSHWGVSPNQISVMSVMFAAIGSIGLYCLPGSVNSIEALMYGLIALVGIQGRLICNLLDGLVAIEGGKKTPVGELYNEVPDRLSDSLLLIAAGFGVNQIGFMFGSIIGIAAALAALSTAYVRVLGGSLGLAQSFRGPMAKQHRMALLNVGVILSVVELIFRGETGFLLISVLVTIFVGSVLTLHLRLRDIAKTLTTKREGQV